MGFKRNIGFFGLLQAFEASSLRNLLDRSHGNPRRNVWLSRLIRGRRQNRMSSCTIFWQLLVISTRRKQVMYNMTEIRQLWCNCRTRRKHLRCKEIKVFDILSKNRGFISRCFLQRGTRRSKFVNSLPLLVHANIFSKHRRRRC
jgi:hypothetical protein